MQEVRRRLPQDRQEARQIRTQLQPRERSPAPQADEPDGTIPFVNRLRGGEGFPGDIAAARVPVVDAQDAHVRAQGGLGPGQGLQVRLDAARGGGIELAEVANP